MKKLALTILLLVFASNAFSQSRVDSLCSSPPESFSKIEFAVYPTLMFHKHDKSISLSSEKELVLYFGNYEQGKEIDRQIIH